MDHRIPAYNMQICVFYNWRNTTEIQFIFARISNSTFSCVIQYIFRMLEFGQKFGCLHHLT